MRIIPILLDPTLEPSLSTLCNFMTSQNSIVLLSIVGRICNRLYNIPNTVYLLMKSL